VNVNNPESQNIGRPGLGEACGGGRSAVRLASAAERLSYSPNALAQGLLAGRTGIVGLLTSDVEGRFSIPILMGAEDAFGAGRTSVLLCDARGDLIREAHHLRTLLSRRVDGLIVVGARPDPRPSVGRALPVPVVYAYAPSDDPDDLSLVSDNVAAGRMAIRHLTEVGRRAIAHISGDPTYGAAQDRAAGALAELAAHGLELAGDRVYFGSWSEACGRSATRMLLSHTKDIDAVFAGSDQIARGVIDALHEAGLDVPGDIAVIGFDNWGIFTTSSRPPLSSIDMNLETSVRWQRSACRPPSTVTSAQVSSRCRAAWCRASQPPPPDRPGNGNGTGPHVRKPA
jgi:LacI family transcriptional regulator, galactose operon repressor